MSKGKAKNTWMLWAALLAAVVVGIILFAVQPPPNGLNAVVRMAALIGYLSVFGAVLSSLYLRELVRTFGRPFIQVHHLVALVGLGLLIVHPLAAALVYRSASVLVPRFSSWNDFFTWGGPPALYLLAIAALVAWQRRAISGWRIVHYLTYLAFILATIHAILLGTDGQLLPVRILAIALALVAAWVFVRKRRPR